MAFLEEVTSTSFSEFITALRNFAATVGFGDVNLTGDNFAFSYGSTPMYWNYDPDSGSSEIRGMMSRSQDTGEAYNAQPGDQVSTPAETDELAANYVKFLLFGDAPSAYQAYVHAVIEVTAGVFKHLHFGIIDKFGTWGGESDTYGGEYMVGHHTAFSADAHSMPWSAINKGASNDHLNVDDARIPTVSSTGFIQNIFGTTNSMTLYHETADVQFGKNGAGWFEDLYHLGQCSFSGINPMYPILVMGRDYNDFQTLYSDNFPLGQVRDMRLISMDGLSAGDIISAGGDDWHVFPVWDKGATKDSDGGEDTGWAGFAFKEVT